MKRGDEHVVFHISGIEKENFSKNLKKMRNFKTGKRRLNIMFVYMVFHSLKGLQKGKTKLQNKARERNSYED